MADSAIVSTEAISRARLAEAGVFLFGIAAVTLYAVFYSSVFYPFSPDSAAYIEAARSLRDGEPLLVTGSDGRAPIALWPPGYPVLIAMVSLLNIEEATAALFLTRASLALLPLAVFWALRPSTGDAVAILAAALSCTSLGLLPNAHLASSDAIFALLAALSLGLFLREKLFYAGAVAGLALLVRSAAIALILAQGAVLMVPLLSFQFRATATRGIRYSAGAALAGAPLFAWNVWAHGTLSPYQMPPSTVGVQDNLTHTAFSYAYDLVPLYRIAEMASWPLLFTVLALTIVAMIVKRRSPFVLFACFYFIIGTAMLVAARSRYEWGEPISIRHVAQYDWLLLAAFLTVFMLRPRVVMALLCLLSLRVYYFVGEYQKIGPDHMRALRLEASRSPELALVVAEIPADCVISSNVAEVIEITYGRHAYEAPERAATVAFRPGQIIRQPC